MYHTCGMHKFNKYEPALVIPTSLNEADFMLQTDKRLRNAITFTNIPFGFIYRDGWGPETNLGLIQFKRNFRKLPFIKKNCPLNLIDTCPNGGMKKQNCTSANAKLVIHDGNRAYLKSTKPILSGEEVLWKYGKDYIMFD